MVGCLMVTQSSECQSLFYMTNVNVSHLHIKKTEQVKCYYELHIIDTS